MLSGLFVGILFGFILQRGQFCFVSGFHNFYTRKNLRFITALLIAISIQSVGFFSLAHWELISLPTDRLPITATISGGLLFGVGMMAANCCGSGAWFRSGEGATGSLLALFGFGLTLAAGQTGALKHWLNPLITDLSPVDNIYLTFGISPWWLVALLLVITALLLFYHFRHPSFYPQAEPSPALILPKVFARTWHPFTTAVLLGGLSIAAWLLSAETGRNFSFGISTPTANVVQYLVIGQQRYLNWGSYFVSGIMLGSLLSAKLSGEFHWRVPEPKAVIQRLAGGVAMGIGATLAGGCIVTNTLVATAYFSWQGWLATFAFLAGCGVAVRFTKPVQCRL